MRRQYLRSETRQLKTEKHMKKIILGLMTATLVGTGAQTASAHDGWSTAGKVLTGLFAARVVADIVAPPPVVYQTTTYYTAPPAVAYAPAPCPPAPAVVYTQPAVVVAPAPICVSPAPVFSFYYGPGYHHQYHGRW
jgi:hypothetical protein